MKKKIINLFKIIGYLLLPFLLSYIFTNTLTLIGISDYNIIKNLAVIVSPLLFLLSYIILQIIRNDKIIDKNDFKLEKNDIKKVIMITLISLGINFLIALIFINKIQRQDTLEILDSMNIWLARLTGIILAPICEEFYFRKGFYKLFDNKNLYVIISGIFFGIIHYSPGNSNFTNIVLVSTISLMGMMFCYVYKKEKRISMTIIPHFINNILAML